MRKRGMQLKCLYDQIVDIHYFTQQVFPGYLAKFQSITKYKARVLSTFISVNLQAAINFPCSNSWL